MKIGKKTAVTKEITRQERNRRNNLKRLSISFIVAFILFIALVIIQSIPNKFRHSSRNKNCRGQF